ncbi:MAG TPA: hypothetical protein DDX04_19620, partial [Massilia sp.]|nr:hypothetical protein [Massilia sp.]
MDQGHRILQHVAEAVCAARLVMAAARPHAAGNRLVQQPAVGQHVERRVGRGDAHRAQGLVPPGTQLLERGAGGLGATMLPHQGGQAGARLAARAEQED